MAALSLAVIAAGGVGGALLLSASGQRAAVLAIARPLTYGQIITADDLVAAHINTDSVLQPIPVSEESSVVGKRAAVALDAGTLLTLSEVTTQPLVSAGQQLVGVEAKPGQLPVTPLTPGASVLVVSTPQQDADVPTAAPQSLSAKVEKVGAADSSGNVVVDLLVDAADGPTLAARVATGRIAIVLQSPADAG